jgi:RNA polymerase sigma-70 factor, ECF subfamily
MSSSGSTTERFMALLDPVHDRLEHFALALTRNGEAARDIVGETILIAYERFDSLRHPEAFLSFLFTIARRVYQRRATLARRTERLEESHWAGLHDTRLAPDASADIRAVYEALDELPEPQREAVILFEILGLSMSEIREIQGGTLVAVKVRISRGRKRLAKILGVDEAPAEPPRANGRPSDSSRTSIDTLNLYTVAEEL